LITLGWSLKSGVELTKPPSLPGRLLALLGREVAADLAEVLELAVLDRHLARHEDQVARDHVGHVVGDGGGRLRQLDAQFLKTRVDLSGHGVLPP
jgi:hypothetical protein